MHFAALRRNRPACENHNAALWKERTEMVFREYDGALKDHSGFYTMRRPETWAALEAAHPTARRTDHVVMGRPITDILGPQRTVVDFFSLDVEGAEMSILRDFPWGQVTVDSWLVETNKLERAGFLDFMAQKKYACHHVDHVNTFCKLTQNATQIAVWKGRGACNERGSHVRRCCCAGAVSTVSILNRHCTIKAAHEPTAQLGKFPCSTIPTRLLDCPGK